MNNFWTRTITGLSMVFILLAALWFSGWVFAVIFLVITILGLWEFYGLISNENCHPQKLYGTFAGAFLFLTAALMYLIPWTLSSNDIENSTRSKKNPYLSRKTLEGWPCRGKVTGWEMKLK